MRPRPAAAACLLLALSIGASPGLSGAGSAGTASDGPEDRARIAVLPFAPRGAPSNAWEEVRDLLYDRLVRGGADVVPHVAVEQELKHDRLRDMSILSREELQRLAASLDADLVLLGYIFRLDGEPDPAVSLSGRLVDPRTLRIERMAVTFFEGRSLLGPLGVGGPVTLERTLGEAVRRFAASILDEDGRGTRGESGRELLQESVLAPSPNTYVAPDLGDHGIRSVVVLPFRDNTGSPGAGQVVADLMVWSLSASGCVEIREAGDAANRLLRRGWRTGLPVGREEIRSLGVDPGVDAVLMGSVETWEEGVAIAAVPPEVSLSARLLETAEGRILWAAGHERLGDQTRVVYEVGNVRLVEALAARSSFEALASLTKALDRGSRQKGARK